MLYCRRQTITQILRTQCIMHFVICCQLALGSPRRQIFPPCFIGKIISTGKLCSSLNILADFMKTFSSFAISRSKHSPKTSQAHSNFVLMKVRYIFDRVCLQRVHFSFLRTLSCLKVQLLYIMVKQQTQVQRSYLLYICT